MNFRRHKQYHFQNKPYKAYTPHIGAFIQKSSYSKELATKIENAAIAIEIANSMHKYHPGLAHIADLHRLFDTYKGLTMDGATTSLHTLHQPTQQNENDQHTEEQFRQTNQELHQLWQRAELHWDMEYLLQIASTAQQLQIPATLRSKQIWIGGNSPHDATFVPPHQHDLPEIMEQYLGFINSATEIPKTIKLSIAYCFLLLSLPLDYSNGTFARYIMQLLLKKFHLTDHWHISTVSLLPQFMGRFNEALIASYQDSSLDLWHETFLDFLTQAAQSSTRKNLELMQYHQKLDTKIEAFGKRKKAYQQFTHQWASSPYLTVKALMDITHQAKPNAGALLDHMIQEGIFTQIGSGQRNRIFYQKALFDIMQTS